MLATTALTPVAGQPWTWGVGRFDFETYSEAGYVWDEATKKFYPPRGAKNKGLNTVGAAVYTEHPSAEVLTLTYKLPPLWFDISGRPRAGGVRQRWKPGDPPPQDLFDYLAAGGILEAFNVMFERLVWANICVPKYGWPSLEPHCYQLRCAMATARVNAFPGKLANLGEVLKLIVRKDANGKRLLDKFSVPRNPTKKDPRTRVIAPHAANPNTGHVNDLLCDPADAFDFEALCGYCDTDVETEEEASEAMEPMTPDELLFWWIDQEINYRGVAVDRAGVRNCLAVLEQALARYGDECRAITGGLDPTQLQAIRGWLAGRGIYTDSLDEEHVTDLLKRLPPPPPQGDPRRRVLEIRQLIGSASVKKLYAMEHQANAADRLLNLIVHHGARTGRPTGEGPQPLNLPKAGPDLKWCGMADDGTWAADACRKPFRPSLTACPWCNRSADGLTKRKWSADACDTVLEIMAARSLELVEWYFGDAVLCIMGCVRGLFVAAPGHDLIASDFTAIEAVVTAMLAGEEWRIQVFRDRKDIYLMSAAKITGRTLEQYAEYKAANKENHPDRQKIGKVAELALGFGGWIAAWRNFDDTDTFSDDEVKRNILAWRDASPKIVELWGGQTRGRPWDRDRRPEFYGFEGAAVQAIQYPGHVFEHAGIRFELVGHAPDVWDTVVEIDPFLYGDEVPRLAQRIVTKGKLGDLKVTLLSGRKLTYRDASLSPSRRDYAAPWELTINYWTWNTNPNYGPMGWVPMTTYGPKLAENIIQAIAHDVLRFAIINLRAAGYKCVLHVYDEIVLEVLIGHGLIEEVERIMSTMPWWAHGWPIFANGGWRGYRYRKA